MFVLARDIRATPIETGRVVHVPAALRVALRSIGLVGWAWIVAQGDRRRVVGWRVATLFLWVYGWVGIAVLSALLVPGVGVARPVRDPPRHPRLGRCAIGVRGWPASEVPAAVRVWPAVLGLAFFVWLELVPAVGAATLTVVLVGYTVLTLALMAQFGRDAWRAQGETFSVWFRTLNRMAPFGVVAAARVAARPGDADEASSPAHRVARAVVRRRSRAACSAGVERRGRRARRRRRRGRSSSTASRRRSCSRLFGARGSCPRRCSCSSWLAIVVGARCGSAGP